MLRKRLSLRNERGQALALVAVLAPTLIGIGGLTIDVGHWYQVTRKAQSAADAAALDAARQIPSVTGGSTAGVQSAGQASVATNMPEASAVVTGPYCDANDATCGQNGSPPKDVKVTVSTTVGTYLAKVVGIGNVGVTKSAVAARAERIEKAGLFAAGTDCKGALEWPGSGAHINGAIISNGGFHMSGSNNYADAATYNQSCDPQISGDGVNLPQGPNPVADPIVEPWPLTFSQSNFTCGNSPIPGNLTFKKGEAVADGIYCATSQIQVQNDVTAHVTLIAPKINIAGGNTTLTAYASGLLLFATQTDIQVSGSSQNWTGVLYAPNGLAQIPGSSNIVGFVEAQEIQISGAGLNLTATGPFVPIGLVKLIG
jgi:Flp pilus assembly protein TadG